MDEGETANVPLFSERYLGFLVQQWQKLPTHEIHSTKDAPVNRTDVLAKTLGEVENTDGLRLEFGVWKGVSIRRCAERFPDRHWYGFDSFEGFPEDGRVDWQKPFKVVELPETPTNVTLVKGFFADSLDPFLAEYKDEVAFVNIDCDLYSSTADVFQVLEKHNRIKAGLVIYFDELINYDGFMWNESKALFEMLERTGLGFDWLYFDQNLRQPSESARLFAEGRHPRWMDDVRAGYWQQASLRLTNNAIDCGPLSDPQYQKLLSTIAKAAGIQELRRLEALAERNRELARRETQRQDLQEERRAQRKQADAVRRQANQDAKRRPN